MMLRRAARFVGGLTVGLLGVVVIILGYGIEHLGLTPPVPTSVGTSFWTDGVPISRDGGVTVLVRGEGGRDTTLQRCRGVCDDLWFYFVRAERVEVRNARGDCLVCQSQHAVLPYQQLKRWALAGSPLRLEASRN